MGLFTVTDIYNGLNLNKYSIVGKGLAKAIFSIIKGNKLNEDYTRHKHLAPVAFADEVLKSWRVNYEISEDDLKRIPKEGPFIIVANHPIGIDGLVMLSILLKKRPDFKIIGNFLLEKILPLKNHLLAVNPFEERQDTYNSKQSFLKAVRHIKNGGCLGIYPAGEVSKKEKNINGGFSIVDRKWEPAAVKLIHSLRVPIIPMYFHGSNSNFFYRLAKIHPSLQTLMLPREAMRKNKKPLQIRIGKPILPVDYEEIKNMDDFESFIRNKTYSLGVSYNPEKKSIEKLQEQIKKPLYKKPKDIVSETKNEILKAELQVLPEKNKLFETDTYSVYWTSADKIPHTLREIGRLREITFREIGEGTNEKIDLDIYDQHYHHLILWDKEKNRIVGSYRMGMGMEIYPSMGKKGFYLNELFDFDHELDFMLEKSMELGRAFVIKDYQTKPLPLYLLWKGILHVTLMHPGYEFIIGSVSISNQFSDFSKSLMIEFMRSNFYDPYIAQFITPKKPFKVNLNEAYKQLFLTEAQSDLNKLDKIIDELEPGPLRLPVLLKKYIKQNAKLIGFNVDTHFNDAIDGLMYIRIKELPESTIKPALEEFKEKINQTQHLKKID